MKPDQILSPLRLLLFVAGFLSSVSAALATPPTPDPGTLHVNLEARGQKQVPVGKPFSISLEVQRASKDALSLFVSLETFALKAQIDWPQKAIADGAIYLDVSQAPVGKTLDIPVLLTLTPGEGSGLSVRVGDGAGGFGESQLYFASASLFGGSGDFAYPVRRAGDVLMPQIERLRNGDKDAVSQLTTATVLAAKLPDTKPQPTQWDVMDFAKFESDEARLRSKAIHDEWDKGLFSSTIPPIPVTGRLVFPDDLGCGSPAPAHQVSWADCHAFKRHQDIAGTPITVDSYVADVYRPLPATLLLSLSRPAEIFATTCDMTAVQTNPDGTFNALLAPCPGGDPNDAYELQAYVFLQYQIAGVPGAELAGTGYVRAFWRDIDSNRLLGTSAVSLPAFTRPPQDGSPAVLYTMPGVRLIEPRRPLPARYDLGPLVLGARGGNALNYLRQVFSAFATMVELHRRAQAELEPSRYLQLFANPHESGRPRTYSVHFDNVWANSSAGGIALLRPGSWGDGSNTSLLSDVDTLGHEFGHSLHGSLARSSLQFDFQFANLMTRPNGTPYDWGHGFGQYQEMGVALVEGIASSLGQYLVDRCHNTLGDLKSGGVASPFSGNMWSQTGDDSQDGSPTHHTRYQLRTVRGLSESSPDYANRANALHALSVRAVGLGHGFIGSNNEFRFAEMGCDLLDEDQSVTYTQRFAGAPYLDDYVSEVFKALSGTSGGETFRTALYQAPAAETAQINFQSLLDTLASFCDRCGSLPQNQIESAYRTERLSAFSARQAPVRLLESLINRGLLRERQALEVLRSNFMETSRVESP